MAASLSQHPRRSPRAATPQTLPQERPASPQSSYRSFTSSERSSELSTALILARADDAPSSYHRGSTREPQRPRAGNGGSSWSCSRTRQGEKAHGGGEASPPPAMTYSPPSPPASMLSVDTYDSRFSECGLDHGVAHGYNASSAPDDSNPVRCQPPAQHDAIPKYLPEYRPGPAESPVRPSDPDLFRHLFPSMDRLSIRHDDGTPDGNMNLRVDTVVRPGSSRRRRPATIQLFHLRMHDLANREFSLRRYCRESGREVCFSKRTYNPASATHHSVSSILRSVKAPFRRSNASDSSCLSFKTCSSSAPRPSTASTTAAKSAVSSSGGTDVSDGSWARAPAVPPPSVPLVPTETIKLEFGNYARVEVSRRNPKRYEFEWWGHRYAWKRAHDKTLNTFSFHLVRDGVNRPVAHVVQETQSPSQIEEEKLAGGWIPPCYMWISDESVIEAMTDVADIIVATGLVVLVDECIREQWPSDKKPTYGSAPLRVGPVIRRGLFSRHGQSSGKPFRLGKAVAVY
ncbi:uncharacterized protein UV8b_01028 [Ustilaginoidea virens]|uniref:Uncharacterized protein n=1 Tax=Ustilaginoidea virens TaxID=1159556 RepID=A0A8E5MEM6_USTVR|nr:uncharacterized protein UV8b_01028 [Ustilaginoidea virens]QUC16787.1 hypothetical protein UV8b_01028 [Ustilaginoidea virens]